MKFVKAIRESKFYLFLFLREIRAIRLFSTRSKWQTVFCILLQDSLRIRTYTRLNQKVGPRLRELAPRGQMKPGGEMNAT